MGKVGRRAGAAIATLTPRQQELLALMAEGHSNAEIATELFVTTSAIERCASKLRYLESA